MADELAAWWRSKTGSYLLKQERAAMNRVLTRVFGFNLVQAGHWGEPGYLLEASPIRTRILLAENAEGGAVVQGSALYLPFANDSVDAVILPHILERAAEPERVLREAERVLHGEGHIAVLGFHPWGPWGLRCRLGVTPPWGGRFLRLGRLREWLSVLGFEIVSVRHAAFRPPWGSRTLMLRSAFLDRLEWKVTAGVYLLLARKRMFCMTPLRPRRTAAPRAFGSMINPSTRNMP